MQNESNSSDISIQYKIINKQTKKRIKTNNNKHIISNRSNNIRSNKYRLTNNKTIKRKYPKCNKYLENVKRSRGGVEICADFR